MGGRGKSCDKRRLCTPPSGIFIYMENNGMRRLSWETSVSPASGPQSTEQQDEVFSPVRLPNTSMPSLTTHRAIFHIAGGQLLSRRQAALRRPLVLFLPPSPQRPQQAVFSSVQHKRNKRKPNEEIKATPGRGAGGEETISRGPPATAQRG